MKLFLNAFLLAATAILLSHGGSSYGTGKADQNQTGTGTAGQVIIGPGTGSTGTGSTGTGSTGTGTGTTGTGGLPPGNQPWQPLMRIERVEEWKAQTSYTASGMLPNQHVARIILQAAGPPPSPPGSTTVTVNGVPTVVPWTLDSYSYTVGVLTPGEEGIVISGGQAPPVATSVPVSYSPYNYFVTAPGISVAVSAYGEVPIQVSANGPFSSGINATLEVCMGFHVVAHYIDPNSGSKVGVTTGAYANHFLNLSEIYQTGSAIDTRTIYGQPNLAGEMPADPNAPPRAVDFTHWIYCGGSFVGANPVGKTVDESGLARMQFWGGGAGSGTCLAATATLFDMGCRTTPTGGETVGIYIPDTGDPKPSLGPGGLTWNGAWSINPSLTRGTPVDYAQTPVSTLTLSATNTGDYLNWNIADTYGTGFVIPGRVFSYMCFALTDETTGPSWHYFGTPSYKALSTTFPANDCVPRIWYVGLVSTTTWTAPS